MPEQKQRTASDYVQSMLAKKVPWMDILAVSRMVRQGKWRGEVEEILKAKKLMPLDPVEAGRLRDEHTKKAKARKIKDEEEERVSRHKGRKAKA